MSFMRFTRLPLAAAILGATLTGPALADSATFSGTRSNISPGGMPGGRCGDALLISFAPNAFAASGTTNFGSFSYTASHCIAGFPPGPYFDGQFTWDFGDGTLSGTYTGLINLGAGPGQFLISEEIQFTAGTGRFAGLTGTATSSGTLQFGQYLGQSASYGDVEFSGVLSTAPVPEPANWALMIAGLGALSLIRRSTRLQAPA